MVERLMGDRVAKRVTGDASGLLALGAVALIRAWSYLPSQISDPRSPAHWLEGLMSPTAWAVLWLVIGLVCIISVWVKRLVPAAVGLIVGLHLGWAFSFLGIWIIGESTRGYVSAMNYALVAWLVIFAFGRGRRANVNPLREG